MIILFGVCVTILENDHYDLKIKMGLFLHFQMDFSTTISIYLQSPQQAFTYKIELFKKLLFRYSFRQYQSPLTTVAMAKSQLKYCWII